MLSKEEKKAIEMLDKFITEHKLFNIKQSDGLEKNIDIVLNLITRLEKENENSISKDIVKKYLEEEQERYNVYKREVEQNNNLKSGLWRHLGAKNMCEKILGIERLVTLD